ncbi:hypothetical protein YC2023_109993 [Brassica napus]
MNPNSGTNRQCNFSLLPRSQVPSNSSREYSGTQGLIDQRSSSFKSPRLKNQTHIRPFTNSSILLQESGGHINGQSSTHHLATDTLVSSNHIHRRRRPQSNECEFGESSSSAKRMRIISPGENNESFADSLLNLREERTTNSVLSPTYRTSGLTVNPHLRRSDDIRWGIMFHALLVSPNHGSCYLSPYGPYDERYEADRQYLDPHMRKFENSVRRVIRFATSLLFVQRKIQKATFGFYIDFKSPDYYSQSVP